MARWTLFLVSVVATISLVTAGKQDLKRDVGNVIDGPLRIDRSLDLAPQAHAKRDRSSAHKHRSHRRRLKCRSLPSDQPDPASGNGPAGTISVANLRALTASGITGFMNENGPGIGSWFRTNAGQDATNGHSWCGYPYNDDSNGFAPDVQVMLNNFGGDYTKAATAYCGLEAIVTTPDGVSKVMHIIDGFDHKWVRTPGSIDITKNRFAALLGSATDDKNKVIKGITWKLTGNRSDQYKFKGVGL